MKEREKVPTMMRKTVAVHFFVRLHIVLLLVATTSGGFLATTAFAFTPPVNVHPLLYDSFLLLRRNGGSVVHQHHQRRLHTTRTTTTTTRLWYQTDKQKNETLGSIDVVLDDTRRRRFERTADYTPNIERPCILTIDNIRYNVTAWAKAHPGGVKVLERFHDKDATKAFHAVHHSAQAIAMLHDFAIVEEKEGTTTEQQQQQQQRGNSDDVTACTTTTTTATTATSMPYHQQQRRRPRWRVKLFTKEDPIGVHKYLGIFVLLNFAFRFFQMLFTDNAAGLGNRLGRGPSWIPVLCLVPHGLLSVSSLIFHTVPRDRVVGKPMIWKEYRIHNIGFGLRSVLCSFLASLSVRSGHGGIIRRVAVWGSSLACLAALVNADLATKYLRANNLESTTATMPYWEGCSVQTQKRFKLFYAYCQFIATLGCLTVTNPAWPLAILLAIQLASLLMTLVRKGLLSTKGYHYGYTIALVLPYFVAFRSMLIMGKPWEVMSMFGLGLTLFHLRRRGVNKYLMWLPVIAARVAVGDHFLTYDIW